eukprot:6460682-Amphidinium_carterae.1
MLMLPKCCLGTKVRGGKAQRTRADNDTKQRLRRWIEGERAELWPALQPKRKRAQQQQEDDLGIRLARAQELLQEGLQQKACAALAPGKAIREVTSQIMTDMQKKHPRARETDLQRQRELRSVHETAAPVIDAAAVGRAIASFPRASAPGCSGLRPQHLKDANAPAWKDEHHRQLAVLVTSIAKGRVPRRLVPWVVGGNLTVLEKPNNRGFRPIAVGETVRRLVAKTLVAHVQEDVVSYLQPLQLGVGTP